MDFPSKLLVASAIAFSFTLALGAQGLPFQWKTLSPSWEKSLEAGEGQKVRQAAEELLKKTESQIGHSNYNDLHAKVAVLSIAARGAVLDGDWDGALSLMQQAEATAKVNYSLANETLGNLRVQHEAKINDWKELIKPAEDHYHELKSLDGLTSQQIRLCTEIEIYLTEHHNAITASEQAIRDINSILNLLKTDEDALVRSLKEWNAFGAIEKQEIEDMGSRQKYVAEKIQQVMADTNRTPFELRSYTRRLLRLDPTNETCRDYLNKLLGKK